MDARAETEWTGDPDDCHFDSTVGRSFSNARLVTSECI